MTAEQEKVYRSIENDLNTIKNNIEMLIYRMGTLTDEEESKLKKIHKALCATIDET